MKLVYYTWSDLDEPVVLDEDCVTGQVAMDDGRVTRVEITAQQQKTFTNTYKLLKKGTGLFPYVCIFLWVTIMMSEKGRPTWELTGSVCTISSKPVGPYTLSERLLAEWLWLASCDLTLLKAVILNICKSFPFLLPTAKCQKCVYWIIKSAPRSVKSV